MRWNARAESKPLRGLLSIEERLRGAARHGFPQELIGRFVCLAPALGAADEALLQEVRLDHVDQRVDFLVERGGQRLDPDRPTLIVLDDRLQKAAVEIVESFLVDAFERERFPRHGAIDLALCLDVGKIAYAPQ